MNVHSATWCPTRQLFGLFVVPFNAILFIRGWESAVSEQSVSEAETVDDELEELDDLGDVDFDLDEVENKIAPLALALEWRA